MKIMIKKEQIDKIDELQKQVNELKGKNTNLCLDKQDLMNEISKHKNAYARLNEAYVNLNKLYEQAIKDTAKEICDLILEHWQGHDLVECDWLIVAISEKYGVDMK